MVVVLLLFLLLFDVFVPTSVHSLLFLHKWFAQIKLNVNSNIFVKKIKIWSLLCCIIVYNIWIEHNNKVFNQEQWHESMVKNLVGNNLTVYTEIAWERVVKIAKIGAL